jgi:hypothetical protein
MNRVQEVDNVQRILSDIDNLIGEIVQVRSRVAALAGEKESAQSLASVKDDEGFGMWVDREDMRGLSSREWLAQIRAQQWAR